MSAKNVSRRKMLKLMGVGTATMGLAACAAPQAAAPAAPSAPACGKSTCADIGGTCGWTS